MDELAADEDGETCVDFGMIFESTDEFEDQDSARAREGGEAVRSGETKRIVRLRVSSAVLAPACEGLDLTGVLAEGWVEGGILLMDPLRRVLRRVSSLCSRASSLACRFSEASTTTSG